MFHDFYEFRLSGVIIYLFAEVSRNDFGLKSSNKFKPVEMVIRDMKVLQSLYFANKS